jgi:hypothetical protein
MKRKVGHAVCLLLVLTGSILVFSGCATGTEDSDNASVRPWNAPKSWETGLPSNMTEGR